MNGIRLLIIAIHRPGQVPKPPSWAAWMEMKFAPPSLSDHGKNSELNPPNFVYPAIPDSDRSLNTIRSLNLKAASSLMSMLLYGCANFNN